jgi:2-C-methyl-D-erythritol 4-phosphate cytidylyltransferase
MVNIRKLSKPMKIIAIIVAAGRGTRAGGKSPKQWQHLGGKRIIDHSIDLFKNISRINKIMVVLHSDDIHLLDRNDVLFTQGGSTRSESVRSGLKALQQTERPDYVLIHDAARPSTPLALINKVIDNLETVNAVSPALPVTDTLWEVIDEKVIQTKSRNNIWRAQTPQGFKFNTILDAHKISTSTMTDDVEVAMSAGVQVKVINGSEQNIKITTAEDFERVIRVLGHK